jgi:hypothetical protein
MKMKKVESELDITNRIIKILEKNDDISKLGAREIRISLDNIRKLLKQFECDIRMDQLKKAHGFINYTKKQ